MSDSDPPPQPPRRDASGPRGAVLVVLTVVVVAVLAVPVLLAAVDAVRDGGGSVADTRSSEALPSSGPASEGATQQPTPGESGSTTAPGGGASGSASASPSPARRATCWDGARARRVSACSQPRGADGLSWVFPSIQDQRCGAPTSSGPAGTVIREVCRARLGSSGVAVVVYTQWDSTADAVAYIRSKGLTESGGRGSTRLQHFTSSGPGDSAKVAEAYTDEPFAYIVTLPGAGDPEAAAGRVVRARPPQQVRGAPSR